jgi:hypothetical protein
VISKKPKSTMGVKSMRGFPFRLFFKIISAMMIRFDFITDIYQ